MGEWKASARAVVVAGRVDQGMGRWRECSLNVYGHGERGCSSRLQYCVALTR